MVSLTRKPLDPEEKWVTIIVIYGDQSKEMKVNVKATVTAMVIEQAIREFNLPEKDPRNYQVFYEGRLLDPHKSLEEQGIKEGAKLVLAHVHVVG
jgi:hypothetical protein